MIRKQELIDAIGDVSRDVFSLSIRVSTLEKELKAIKKRTSSKEEDELEKALAKVKLPKRRGRPVGSGKKAKK